MVVFPVAKLGYLAVRQVSKPLANSIKMRAKNSPFFRNWICMPPAQLYHWAEVNVRMRVMNMGAPTKVSRLSEQQAIDLGAEMLGEFIIFSIAVGCLTAEYKRSSRKEALKEQIQLQRLVSLEHRLRDVGFRMEKQSVQIRELTRCVADLATSSSGGWLSKKSVQLHPLLQEATEETEVPHYGAPILIDLQDDAAEKSTELPVPDPNAMSKSTLLSKLRSSKLPNSDKKSSDHAQFSTSAVSQPIVPQNKSAVPPALEPPVKFEILDEKKPNAFMNAAAIEKLTARVPQNNEQVS